MERVKPDPLYMGALEFINRELEFDLNNPYVPIEKENVGVVDEEMMQLTMDH